MNPQVKKRVYTKYRDKCIFCRTKKSLHIHHINTNSKDNRLLNLLLVCRDCHLKVHGKIPAYQQPAGNKQQTQIMDGNADTDKKNQ